MSIHFRTANEVRKKMSTNFILMLISITACLLSFHSNSCVDQSKFIKLKELLQQKALIQSDLLTGIQQHGFGINMDGITHVW